MDNIRRVTLLQRFTRICKYISIAIPLIVDIFGVVALFADGIQAWISTNISLIPCIVIVVVLNILLIANIFVIVEKTTIKKVNRTAQLVSGYKKILTRYADHLIDFDEKCKTINSVDVLYKETSTYLKTLVDDMRDVLSKTTGAKIRVCVKAFPEKYDHHDVFKMQLITFCRSDKSLVESVTERNERVPVHKNTDFKLIMIETYPYFAFDNLKNFEKVTKTEYENSTEHWEKKYLSTIVFPISKCVSTDSNGKESFEVLGFLCVDTLSTKAFSSDVGPMCIDFVESLSYLMYAFLDKCIQCRKTIEKQQAETKSV